MAAPHCNYEEQMIMNHFNNIHPSVTSPLKRFMDVSIASFGLFALSPIIGATALAIRIFNGKPVFFYQLRPGLDAQLFEIKKFRTMTPSRPDDEYWFRTDRERLTRLGRLIRKLSIDELPELLNVIEGKMSIVGPRPLLKEYLLKYTPEESRRHNVKPGITGWAQVNGRQHVLFSKRLELDLWYVDNWSIWLDFKIIAMTLKQVVLASGIESGQNFDDVDDIGISADRYRIYANSGNNSS